MRPEMQRLIDQIPKSKNKLEGHIEELRQYIRDNPCSTPEEALDEVVAAATLSRARGELTQHKWKGLVIEDGRDTQLKEPAPVNRFETGELVCGEGPGQIYGYELDRGMRPLPDSLKSFQTREDHWAVTNEREKIPITKEEAQSIVTWMKNRESS